MEEITLVPLDEPAAASPAVAPRWLPRRQGLAMDPTVWVRAYISGDAMSDEHLLDVVEAMQRMGMPVFLDAGDPDGHLVVLVGSADPPPDELDFLRSVSDQLGPLWFLLVARGGENLEAYRLAVGMDPILVHPDDLVGDGLTVLADRLAREIRQRFTFSAGAPRQEVWE